jgi:hypothetical protein
MNNLSAQLLGSSISTYEISRTQILSNPEIIDQSFDGLQIETLLANGKKFTQKSSDYLRPEFSVAINNSLVQGKSDLIFLVSGAATISSIYWSIAKNFMSDFVNAYGVSQDRRVGLVTYGFGATVELPLSFGSSSTSVQNAINNLVQRLGLSNLHLGLQSAFSQFDTHTGIDREKKLVIITDGVVATDPCSLYTEITGRDIFTYIVGNANPFDPSNVQCLVEDPATMISQIESSTGLAELMLPLNYAYADNIKLSLFFEEHIIVRDTQPAPSFIDGASFTWNFIKLRPDASLVVIIDFEVHVGGQLPVFNSSSAISVGLFNQTSHSVSLDQVFTHLNRFPTGTIVAPHMSEDDVHKEIMRWDVINAYDADGDSLAYSWDLLGDGNYLGFTSNPSFEGDFRQAKVGDFNETISVQISDGTNITTLYGSMIISNTVPVVSLLNITQDENVIDPNSIMVNSKVIFNFDIYEPGPDYVQTAIFIDGTYISGRSFDFENTIYNTTYTFEHIFVETGIYEFNLTVFDGSTGETTSTLLQLRVVSETMTATPSGETSSKTNSPTTSTLTSGSSFSGSTTSDTSSHIDHSETSSSGPTIDFSSPLLMFIGIIVPSIYFRRQGRRID